MNEKKSSDGIGGGELKREREREGKRIKAKEGRYQDVSWTRRASALLMDDERVVRLPKGHS
jgi:hypothetical protein